MTRWRELHLPGLDEAQAVGFFRALAANQGRGGLVWEIRTEAGTTRYLLGADPADLSATLSTLRRLLPGITVTTPTTPRREVERAGRLQMRGRYLNLALDARAETLRAVLAALSGAVGKDDVLVLQVVLGRALPPELLPATSPDPGASVGKTLLTGPKPAERSVHARMQDKLAQYRFRTVVRIGVTSASPVRRRLLIHGLLAAIRTLQSSGVKISL